MSKRARSNLGFVLAVLAAALMLLDVLSVPWGSALGLVAIAVIASANASGRPGRPD